MTLFSRLNGQLFLGTALAGMGLASPAIAGNCLAVGQTVTCSLPANPTTDQNQTFGGLTGSAVVTVTSAGGIDTRTTADYQHALAVRSSGTLTITNSGLIAGSNYGLIADATDSATVVNNGSIISTNNDALVVYGFNGGAGVDIVNNGSVSGAKGGIVAVNNGGSISITTGSGSTTSGGDAALLPDLIYDNNVWSGVGTVSPPQSVSTGGYGIQADNYLGGVDLTITVGADSTVGGAGGILALNQGTGETRVVTGANSQVLNTGQTTVNGVTTYGHGGIEVANQGSATVLYIETGANSVVGGLASSPDIGFFGIVATNMGAGPTQIVTGASSHVAASAIGILAHAANFPTDITTGADSVVDGHVAGILVGGTSNVSMETGTGSHIEGGWAGIISNTLGDLEITTGEGSSVEGLGGLTQADFPPGMAIGPLPFDITTVPSSGIRAMATHLDNQDTNLKVTTGANSAVTSNGYLSNGIDALAGSLNVANIEIQTGANSTVTGGDDGISSPSGLGGGIGILATAQGLNGANVAIATGADSTVQGGAAGISGFAFGSFNPTTLSIVTGDRSKVFGTAAPTDVVSGDPTYGEQHTAMPVSGIVASGFGGMNSTVSVKTGKDSEVSAASFGIVSLSGAFNSSVDIQTGDNSSVVATGAGPWAYQITNGQREDYGPLGEVYALHTPAAGIFVSSQQFNDFNQIIPTSDPAAPFEFLSVSGNAAPINVTTGINSSVIGKGNGIAVVTNMLSQKEAFVAQDGTIFFAPPRIDQNGSVRGADGDNDPTNDPYLEKIDFFPSRQGISGVVNVTVNGTVTGQEEHGVYSLNSGNAAAVNINVGTTGIVEGNKDAIFVRAYDFFAGMPPIIDPVTGQPTTLDQSAAIATINNSGTIRNLSKVSSDLAIQTLRTATTVNNSNFVLGTVDLDSDAGNHFVNKAGGVWDTSGGTNEFGDAIANNSLETQADSTIIAANTGSAVQTTTFNGLGNFIHGGALTLQDGGVSDVARITGQNSTFVSDGGTLLLDTFLAEDGSPSDLLVIGGNTVLGSGPTSIVVSNAGGPGAQTNADGIKVVQVDGNSAGGVFVLDGDYTIQGEEAVIAGAYGYTLWHNGIANPNDGDWYLRSTLIDSPLYQPGAPVFEAYPQVLLGLNGLPTLQQRVGNRYWSGAGAGVISQGADAVEEAAPQGTSPFIEGSGIWGRIEGAHTSIHADVSTSGASYDYNILKIQAGIDGQFYESDAGKLIGGVTVHYGHASADVFSRLGNGDISTDGYGFGGTLTWYGNNGFYVDGQAQVSWYDSDLQSAVLGQLAKGHDGFGYALSLESGRRLELNNGLTMTPQAQLVYSAADFDDFTQTFGGRDIARVSLEAGDSLRGRLGITLDKEASWQADNGMLSRSHVYGIANLHYEFLNGTRVDVAGVDFSNRADRLWGEIGAGGSYNWNDDKFSIYGEGSVSTSLADFGDSYNLKGTAGFRVKW